MKLENKRFTFGKSFRSDMALFWFVEWNRFLWQFRKNQKDTIFLQSCTIENGNFHQWHKIFWLGRYVYAVYEAREEQRKELGIVIS